MAFSMKLPQGKKTKQYGLIMPKGKTNGPTTASVFAVAAQEDNDAKAAPQDVRRAVADDAARSVHATRVAQVHQSALEQDASVFDYDGVYDSMQSERQRVASQRKAQRESERKKPQYIATLMEKAKIREIEHERMRERRLLNERKADDALYADKEKLVSASYKRKLMEMKKWDQEDARLDEVEAAEDVTKRGTAAMAGFYANLMTKNVAMGGAVDSKSAYTVGISSSGRPEENKEDKPKQEHDEAESSSPAAHKKMRVESQERDEEQPEQGELAKKAATPVAAAVAAPGPSKEDKIAAAKARFLARKAGRQ